MGKQYHQLAIRNVSNRRIDAFLEFVQFLRLVAHVTVVKLRRTFVHDLCVLGIKVLDQGIFDLGAVVLVKVRPVLNDTTYKILAVLAPVGWSRLTSGLAQMVMDLFQGTSRNFVQAVGCVQTVRSQYRTHSGSKTEAGGNQGENLAGPHLDGKNGIERRRRKGFGCWIGCDPGMAGIICRTAGMVSFGRNAISICRRRHN